MIKEKQHQFSCKLNKYKGPTQAPHVSADLLLAKHGAEQTHILANIAARTLGGLQRVCIAAGLNFKNNFLPSFKTHVSSR